MANLKAGTLIGGNMIWHAGNVPFDYANGTLYINGKKIYSELDKPTPAEVGAISTDQLPTGSNYTQIVGKLLRVGTDGVTELGRMIDFHVPDSTVDHDVRLTAYNDGGASGGGWLRMTGGKLEIGSGGEVYHKNNKPTSADVGALALTGGIVTGTIVTSNINAQFRGQRENTAVNMNDRYNATEMTWSYTGVKDRTTIVNGFPMNNNANAVLTFNTHSGNYGHQIGFSDSGKMYHRNFTGAWGEVYTAVNKPTPTDVGLGNVPNTVHTSAATVNTVVLRDGSGDINVRLVRSSYANQSTISGAMAFRVSNSSDNYIRFCSDTGAIRTWLGTVALAGSTMSGDLKIQKDDAAIILRGGITDDPLKYGRVRFEHNSGDQHVQILHSVHDTHRAPFGVRVMKTADNGSVSGKAWLEAEGEIYADGTKRVYHEGWKPTAADTGALKYSAYSGNLNGLSESGMYRMSTGVTGIPVGASGNGDHVIMQQWDSNSGYQIYTCYSSGNNGKMWTRHKVGGNWQAWKQVYDSGNKPSPTDIGAYTKAEVDNLGKLRVLDVRSEDRLPSYFTGKTVTPWFNNTGMPTSGWYSGITIKGWEGSYNTWQLLSNSHSGASDNKLYFRTGNETAWNPTYEVYHSGRKPTAADLGVVPASDVSTSGAWANIINKIPKHSNTGALEVGKYIDMHDTNSTADYNVRLTANANHMSVSTQYGTIDIGAQNVSYAHIYTDRPEIYTNATMNVPRLKIREGFDFGGDITTAGNVTGGALGVSNSSSTTGKGISLYSGSTAGAPGYGLMFAGTTTFGQHGSVVGDWATYFTMSGATNRGWIFKSGNAATGNVASISSAGDFIANGKVQGGYLTAVNSGNAVMELHIPGKHAGMMWVNGTTGEINIGVSNGAGSETRRMATWERSTSHMRNYGAISIPSVSTSWGAQSVAGGIIPLNDAIHLSTGEWHPLVTSPSYRHTSQGYTSRWQIGHFRGTDHRNGDFVVNMTGDGYLRNNLRFHFSDLGQLTSTGHHDGGYWTAHSGGFDCSRLGGNIIDWTVGNFETKANVTSWQSIGSYGMFFQLSGAAGPGATRAGSQLYYCDAEGKNNYGSPPGTWRCHGQSQGHGNWGPWNVTVWQRIA